MKKLSDFIFLLKSVIYVYNLYEFVENSVHYAMFG